MGKTKLWGSIVAENVDVLVVGAGVIGLAVARELARQGREVLILERHDSVGTEISSRNSEVIHSGIYYPHESLKARLCVLGKKLLYRYCDEYGVSYARCGKLILATSKAHLEILRQYQKKALENGAGELAWLNVKQVGELEPEVFCLAGLHSESTGIIDTHALLLSLLGDVEAHGGSIAFNANLKNWTSSAGRVQVECEGMDLSVKLMINAAGLNAPAIANMCRSVEHLSTHYAKGHYYALTGKSPFKQLVYPIAEAGGLGVHVTLDMAGQARFGPDVCWIDTVDYGFDTSNRPAFVNAIKSYYPSLDESRLVTGYTGIRPKLAAAGIDSDFLIETEKQHGVRGLVNLAGIESPGLTSSLAIAKFVLSEIKNSA